MDLRGDYVRRILLLLLTWRKLKTPQLIHCRIHSALTEWFWQGASTGKQVTRQRYRVADIHDF